MREVLGVSPQLVYRIGMWAGLLDHTHGPYLPQSTAACVRVCLPA